MLLHEELTYKILGACFEVYQDKGCGFLEAVYQECLAIEFDKCGIPFVAQPELHLSYKGHPLNKVYVADFICYDKVLIEIKTVKSLTMEHRAQVINYLKGSGLELGLLINFGHFPLIEHERIIANSGRFVKEDADAYIVESSVHPE